MKPFNSVTIVKFPLDLVWISIRDRLPELVPFMEDMEKITQLKREDLPGGIVRLDNLWQANPKLPILQSLNLKPEMFAWIDRAEWQDESYECRWEIESQYLADSLECRGVTHYEPAMGGRGTRVNFEGQLGIGSISLPGIAYLDGSYLKGFEALASSLIPKNLRKMTTAVEVLLKKEV